jgi:5-methyltetrahydrofolate--homocysteine methyltransferase
MNVDSPDAVRAVHRAYIQAGSQIILTNTFGGSRIRLDRDNLADRAPELNKAGAQLACLEAEAADQDVIVAGSMGPCGELLEPYGTVSYEQVRDTFAEQARALAEGGVEVIWIETMSDLNEVKAAIEGTRSACDLPTSATMTFDTNGRTMMGVKPEQAAEVLGDLDLIAVGANCGNGPDEIETVIEIMRAIRPDAILVAKANAGIPKFVDGEIVYDGTPEVMADYAKHVKDLGANLIGACCGSTPAHIKAMALALEK